MISDLVTLPGGLPGAQAAAPRGGGKYRIKYAVTQFKQAAFLIPQLHSLRRLNPANDHPHLPPLVATIGDPDDWPPLPRPYGERPIVPGGRRYGLGLVFAYLDAMPLRRNIPGEAVRTVAPAGRGYVNRRLARLAHRERAGFLADLALRVLRAYRATYERAAGEVYVNGDLDATGILILDRPGEGIGRVVFVDNDSTTPLAATGPWDRERKRLSKRGYHSPDRARRLGDPDTPAERLCLPRDDLYALCRGLLDACFADGYLEALMAPEGLRANRGIERLRQWLLRYQAIAETRYAIDDLMDGLRAIRGA